MRKEQNKQEQTAQRKQNKVNALTALGQSAILEKIETKFTENEHIETSNDPFLLERYRFILQQIHTLNENVHKYLSLFQVLLTTIIGAGAAIFVSWKQLSINAEATRVSILGLLWLLIILALFVILSILAGIFSWLDYRKEEIKLLSVVRKTVIREPPKVLNFWRWYETYIIFIVIAVVVLISFFVHHAIIPLIVDNP